MSPEPFMHLTVEAGGFRIAWPCFSDPWMPSDMDITAFNVGAVELHSYVPDFHIFAEGDKWFMRDRSPPPKLVKTPPERRGPDRWIVVGHPAQWAARGARNVADCYRPEGL